MEKNLEVQKEVNEWRVPRLVWQEWSRKRKNREAVNSVVLVYVIQGVLE